MRLTFRRAAIAGSGICFALAALWIGSPQFILWLWQVGGSESTFLMARRGAALLLGIGVVLWLARDTESSPARHAIAVGFSVSCAALAALGTYEFAAGHAGLGVFSAVIVEAALALAFAMNAIDPSGPWT
jgi:hypothetical protein